MIISAVDIFVIFFFVVLNVIVGFQTRSRIKNFGEYASGIGTKFSDLTIVSTTAATMCSASLFVSGIEQVYQSQLFIIIVYLFADVFACIVCSIFFIPYIMKLKTFTINEWVGSFYGEKIRALFSLCEVSKHIGRFAIQLRLIGTCAAMIFGLEQHGCNVVIWCAAILLMVYASYGGLRAVSYTDIVQFMFFVTIVPLIAIYLWHVTGIEDVGHEGFAKLFNKDIYPKMTLAGTFTGIDVYIAVAAMLTWSTLAIPISMPYYQRIRMCKNVGRAQKLFTISSFVYWICIIFILFIGLQLLGISGGVNPKTHMDMEQKDIMPYLLGKLALPGLGTLMFLCILSLAVSTSDSEFNGMAVLLANDVLPVVSKKFFSNRTRSAVVSSTIGGMVALILALYNKDIFTLLMGVQNFFLPVVSVPLVATLFGFRTHRNSLWGGITCGIVATISYMFIMRKSSYYIYAFGPGMFANAIGLFTCHLYYKKRGWRWIDQPEALDEARDNLAEVIKQMVVNGDLDKDYPQEYGEQFEGVDLIYAYRNSDKVMKTIEYKRYKEMILRQVMKVDDEHMKDFCDFNGSLIDAISDDLDNAKMKNDMLNEAAS